MPKRLAALRPVTAIAVASTIAVVAAGCAGSSGEGGATAAAEGGTLTIGLSGDAQNLDTANCVPTVFCPVAYDTLVHLSPGDGSLQPGLATEWAWTDATHTTMRFTLRDGAEFADGTAVTGQAVADSLNSYLKAPGPFAALSYPLTGAAAAGDGAVDVTYGEALTSYYGAYVMSGQNGSGYIVAPDAAKDRSLLAANTDGSGPYKLDPAQTQKGVQYVYVPNEHYYAQDAVKYDKVVLKPMPDPSARLNAARSGQIDWAMNVPTTDESAAKSAGLTISQGALGSFVTLALQSRDSGPLADVRVRQALAHATPRSDIASALLGAGATPTGSIIPKGAEGYVAADTDLYATDLATAKSLLAEAGYPNGFTMSVFDASFFDPGSAIGQALTSAYAEIGVTVDLVTSNGNPGEVALEHGKYDAFVLSNGGNGVSAAVATVFRPGGLGNPKGVALDPALTAALSAAALNTDDSKQDELAQAVTKELDQLVYSVPIASVPSIQAVRSSVENVPEEYFSIEADPFGPDASEAWQG